jgi:hypothetical protein
MAPGVFLIDGMNLQIPAGEFRISELDGEVEMSIGTVLLRLDLWPVWLEVGCTHAATAAAATARLSPELDDLTKAALIRTELREAIVALTGLAFALDGFYGVVQQELGRHPDSPLWRKKREEGNRPIARHTQVTETLRHHLKLGPNFSRNLSTILKQLFEFRGRAVHPDARYVVPNYRPEIDNAVHPHLLTFSGPHAIHARALVLVLLDRLVDRATEVLPPTADRAWLVKGREELDRLMPIYRVPGDEEPAWKDCLAPPVP